MRSDCLQREKIFTFEKGRVVLKTQHCFLDKLKKKGATKKKGGAEKENNTADILFGGFQFFDLFQTHLRVQKEENVAQARECKLYRVFLIVNHRNACVVKAEVESFTCINTEV